MEFIRWNKLNLIFSPSNAKMAALYHLSSNDSTAKRPNRVVNTLF